MEGVVDLPGNVDDYIEARSLLRSWFQVQPHIITVYGNWPVGIARRLLVLVILTLVVRLKVGAVCHLRSDRRVFLSNGGVEVSIHARLHWAEHLRQP